jgi:cytochrome c oxidase assembly protein subunit 15
MPVTNSQELVSSVELRHAQAVPRPGESLPSLSLRGSSFRTTSPSSPGAPTYVQPDPEQVAAVTGLSATASFSLPLLKPKTAIEFAHRVTSGVSLVLVAILLIWCWRRTAKSDWPRASSVAAAVLLFNEALLGALLVSVDHVGGLDRSTTHAFFLCLHFGNTLLLLAALALTARWLSVSCPRFGFVRPPHQMIATGLGLVSVMVIGITGSLASLGDTLFPAESLRHAVVQDFSSSSHILLRLRVLHPIAAVIGSLYVLWLIQAFWRKPERSRWLFLLPITLAGQIALGATNVILLAPVWLQMMHLLVAEIFWILLVLASADQLLVTHPSGDPLSRNETTAANWSLAFNTTDHIYRCGGPSS